MLKLYIKTVKVGSQSIRGEPYLNLLYGVRSFLVKCKTVNLEKTGRYRPYTQTHPCGEMVNTTDLNSVSCWFDSSQGYKKTFQKASLINFSRLKGVLYLVL